jgi:hypothetical protein
VTIHYATVNGTATTADRDYAAVSGAGFDSSRWSNRQQLSSPLLATRKPETDEIFYVQLIRAFGAVISDGLAEGTIYNDDAGKVIPPPPAPTGFSTLAEAAAQREPSPNLCNGLYRKLRQ